MSGIKSIDYEKDDYSFAVVKSNENLGGMTYNVDFVLENGKDGPPCLNVRSMGSMRHLGVLYNMDLILTKQILIGTPPDIAIISQQKQCAESILTHYMFHFNEMNEVLYNVVGNAYPNSTEILRKAIREKQIVTLMKPQGNQVFGNQVPLIIPAKLRNRKEMNNTAFHVAAIAKDYEKMSILLEAGFSARHYENDKGKTPYDYFKFEGNVKWLDLYEHICKEAKRQQCSVEDYMSKKLIEAKLHGSIDMLGDTLDEAIKSKLCDFSSRYEAIVKEAVSFNGKHLKKQADLVQNIVKSKKVTSRSKRFDALQRALCICNEYLCENNFLVGNELSSAFDKANRQLKKWHTAVDSMTIRLEREFRSKDLMKLKEIMHEAKKLPVISDEFAEILIDKENKMNQMENELHKTLISAGVPEGFVHIYIKRLCSNIDELHDVRWLEIKNVGLDNKEQCKIIARNLQKRGGFDLVMTVKTK